MALQLFKIADVTVATPQASVEFTSIPSAYTDLLIMFSLRDNDTSIVNNILLTLNGSATGYSERLLLGDGSTVTSGTRSNVNIGYLYSNSGGSTTNTFSNGSIYIPNYTSSNNKSISIDSVGENNATTAYVALDAALWSNSAAITSIKLTSSSGYLYMSNSTVTLYGIL